MTAPGQSQDEYQSPGTVVLLASVAALAGFVCIKESKGRELEDMTTAT